MERGYKEQTLKMQLEKAAKLTREEVLSQKERKEEK